MIDLIQHSVDESTLTGYYNRIDDITLKMNKDIIIKDRNRLEEMSKKPKSKIDLTNIKALINYLNKLIKIIDKDENFELAWGIKDGLPISYPLTLLTENVYGIYADNYVEADLNEHIVEVNLNNLADLIAYSFMSRDLGETHESIEELLKNCGIIGIEDSNIIICHFNKNGDKPYEFSKSFMIGNTPYYSFDTKEIYDYFHSKKFKTDKYREVVDYSCKYAATIIMNSIIENSTHLGISVKPIVINTTNLAFITNAKDEVNIKNNLIDEISIRVFGRKFKVHTHVDIF